MRRQPAIRKTLLTAEQVHNIETCHLTWLLRTQRNSIEPRMYRAITDVSRLDDLLSHFQDGAAPAIRSVKM